MFASSRPSLRPTATTTRSAVAMKPRVAQAVEELRVCFPDATVVAHSSGDGGALVTIDPIDPGPAYAQRTTWLKFAIAYQYPYADVYPLFVRPDLTRIDGQPHGDGIAMGSFDEESALQLSRRSKGLNPATDTAALKVTKVLKWLHEQ